jgi:hypothetical protein
VTRIDVTPAGTVQVVKPEVMSATAKETERGAMAAVAASGNETARTKPESATTAREFLARVLMSPIARLPVNDAMTR